MIGILQHGIVQVLPGGETRILRPGRNGGRPTVVAVEANIAERHRLADGDVVTGQVESFDYDLNFSDGKEEPLPETDHYQVDEPYSSHRSGLIQPSDKLSPTMNLTHVELINGMPEEMSDDRPLPKTRRSQSERTRPDRLITFASKPGDLVGRMVDFAAPLGLGDVGVISGQHGSGLSYTMRAIVNGLYVGNPDCIVIVLMIQSRSEEVTDLRRRFPDLDIVVCPVASSEVSASTALLIPQLAMQTAKRFTEMGRDVVLVIDSLTAFWGILLDLEEANAQAEADRSAARQLIRDYLANAGCFHGQSPLGGSLGGTLTILGTVWDKPIDAEAEEDRETHPHLRLMEHIGSELNWRVPLDSGLAEARYYPAIDIRACLSRSEEGLLPSELYELLLTARGALPRNNSQQCYSRVVNAIAASDSLLEVCRHILL